MKSRAAHGLALAIGFVALGVPRPALAAPFAPQCFKAAESAQELQRASRLREARAQLLVCVQSDCHPQVRSDCEKWLADLDTLLPSIVLHARDARGHDVEGVRVSVDGKVVLDRLNGAALPIDPGPHALRFEARSGTVVEDAVVVAVKEQNRPLEVHFDAQLRMDGSAEILQRTPPPQEGARRIPTASFILGGVSLAALGTFGAFELAGQSGLRDVRNGCGQTTSCTESDVDPTRAKFIAAGISLGVAAIALGVATWVYFSARASEQTP